MHVQTLPEGGPAARMRALAEARRSTRPTLVGGPAVVPPVPRPSEPTLPIVEPVAAAFPAGDTQPEMPVPSPAAPPPERSIDPEEAEATRQDMPRLRLVPGVVPRRPDALPQVGDHVEGYEVLEEVGRGGMGRVYRARHDLTGQEVALKMLLPRLAPERQHRARFVNEAKVLAKLDHPNLVPLLGFLESHGRTFIVMPYVKGVTLDQMVRRQGRLPQDVALELFDQIGAGLGHVHEHRIVHRDLKPANVIVRGDGRAMLTDFGIARAIGADKMTATGMVVGTAEYLAPEQAAGESRDDPRSDVYALGVLLFEMLTGQVPFRHPNPAEVLRHHVSTPPPPPRLIVPEMPAGLEAALLKALEKDPDDRFQSVVEFRDAVRAGVKLIRVPGPLADVGPAARGRAAAKPVAAPPVATPVPVAKPVPTPAPARPVKPTRAEPPPAKPVPAVTVITQAANTKELLRPDDWTPRLAGLAAVVAGVCGLAWWLLRVI
jgi:serine/threonine-protein kinase